MNEVTVHQSPPIDQMLVAAQQLGIAFAKSGMFGCNKEEQGVVLAMHCLMQGKSPLEIMSEYNIIDGKLSMRSDSMLAKLSANGGQFQWTADGDDGKTARLKIQWKEREQEVSYTMQDAIKQGIVRQGSAWQKTPGAMLRARCISKAMRMIAPELVAGCYVPEEVQDFEQRPTITATVTEKATPLISEIKEKLQNESNPAPSQSKTCVEFLSMLDPYKDKALEWLRDKCWLSPLQNLDDLPEVKMKEIMSRIDAFVAKINEEKK